MTQANTPDSTCNTKPASTQQLYLNFTGKTNEKGRGRKIIKGNWISIKEKIWKQIHVVKITQITVFQTVNIPYLPRSWTQAIPSKTDVIYAPHAKLKTVQTVLLACWHGRDQGKGRQDGCAVRRGRKTSGPHPLLGFLHVSLCVTASLSAVSHLGPPMLMDASTGVQPLTSAALRTHTQVL